MAKLVSAYASHGVERGGKGVGALMMWVYPQNSQRIDEDNDYENDSDPLVRHFKPPASS